MSAEAAETDSMVGSVAEVLSDDLWSRLVDMVPDGRCYALADQVEPAGDGHLIQYSTGIELPFGWTDVDLAAFRKLTRVWRRGPDVALPLEASVTASGEPVALDHEQLDLEVVTTIGRLPMPAPVEWGRVYEHDNGLGMRALVLYDIEADTFLIRWDVLASRAGGA